MFISSLYVNSLVTKQLKIFGEFLLLINVFKLVSSALWIHNLTINYLLARNVSLICIFAWFVLWFQEGRGHSSQKGWKHKRKMTFIMRSVTTRNTSQLRKRGLTQPFVQFSWDLAGHIFYYRNIKFIQYIFFRKFYFFRRKLIHPPPIFI